MTALADRSDFNGFSLVYLPKYVPSDHPLFRASDEEIEQKFFPSLLQMFPDISRDDIVCVHTARDRFVFCPPVLNEDQSAPSLETALSGVYTVNSAAITDGTLNVNETLRPAEKSLDSILR